MKKVFLLSVLFIFSAMNVDLHGQNLMPERCPTGINLQGFRDRNTGQVAVPHIYERVWIFSGEIQGLARVRQNVARPGRGVQAELKYGFIDINGNEVVPLRYDEIFRFSDQIQGLALVRIGDNFGFIDKLGNEVIPVKFSNRRFVFSEGLAVAMIGDMYGFIDKKGREIIPFRYNFAENFLNGVARVRHARDYGFIDIAGNFYRGQTQDAARRNAERRSLRGEFDTVFAQIEQANNAEVERLAENLRAVERIARENRERAERMATFSFFAQGFVEDRINQWQRRGDFEPTADWQKRVTYATREAKAREFLVEAEQAFITERSRGVDVGNMTLLPYDPDNQTFLTRNSVHGYWVLPVPLSEAPDFQSNWNSLVKTPRFAIIDDHVAIAGMDFTMGHMTFQYSNEASLTHTIVNIDYNFAPIDLHFAGGQRGQQNISTADLRAGSQSRVARNIPQTNIVNSNTFAVVIANENYQSVSDVEFAINDGEVFRDYLIQTLGIPVNNVRFVANATLNNMRGVMNWLHDVAVAWNGEANIIFYYAGHGIPDERTRNSFLLPVDGLGTDFRTGYSLDELYQELGQMPARSVVVFLDACFSGAERSGGGEMLIAARGVAIRAQPGTPRGNMVVFSAAQGDETAFPYREQRHGMFTFFLLSKLQQTSGNVTLGELADYIETNVRRQSILINNKSQTPAVVPAVAMRDIWRDMRLKP